MWNMNTESIVKLLNRIVRKALCDVQESVDELTNEASMISDVEDGCCKHELEVPFPGNEEIVYITVTIGPKTKRTEDYLDDSWYKDY
jgi:hypothetical protein